MIDTLLRIALSNAVFSIGVALAALLVASTVRNHRVAHLVWLLVFIKLLTPPMVMVPISNAAAGTGDTALIAESMQASAPSAMDAATGAVSALMSHRQDVLLFVWFVGVVIMLVVSLTRVLRFNALVKSASVPAPDELQGRSHRLARGLGMKAAPVVFTTDAQLSPMVWWIGGRLRIIVPAAMIAGMIPHQFDWILAHELAHVRRRDHLVRWVEWAATLLFWWNPVVWWARRNLREHEELCCDAEVVSSLGVKPRIYADSLFRAVEFLARPVVRPLALASEINSGGFLQKRFKMIVTGGLQRTNPRWVLATIAVIALIVLPFGIGCQEGASVSGNDEQSVAESVDADLRGWLEANDNPTDRGQDAKMEALAQRIKQAVSSGELSREEGAEVMGQLRLRISGYQMTEDKRRPGPEDLEHVARELEEGVDAGRLTPEQARDMWNKVRDEAAYNVESDRPNLLRRGSEYELAAKKIQDAIADGQMTPDEGERKLTELKRRVEESEDDH